MPETYFADCLDWMAGCPSNSIHALCADPPYGLVEFKENELDKMRAGKGGIWRLPPVYDGKERAPLPRFTVLNTAQRADIEKFFERWGIEVARVLVPGGHVLIAGVPLLTPHVQMGMIRAGFEVRATIIRLYGGFRGGDRPKNAEEEFSEVCVSPKSAYEPWMLLRKPIGEKTVAANLRKWGTGGLRRLSLDKPLPEVIPSGKTPRLEAVIAPHPCLKPQHFLRVVVRSLLPLGEGVVLDPFMGSGSTLAAAQAVGYQAVGIETDPIFFQMAHQAIQPLSELYPDFAGETLKTASETPQLVLSHPTLFED